MAAEKDPLSPCVGICKLDEKSGLCTGCHRSIEEIKGWKNYSEAEKHRLLAQLEKRG